METNCELVVKGWIDFLVNITEIKIAYVVNRTTIKPCHRNLRFSS